MNHPFFQSMVTSLISTRRIALVWATLGLLIPLSFGATPFEEDLALSRAALSERRWSDALPPTLRAAEAGHIPSQHNLANMYAQGLGGAQSWPEARRWWRKAADAGHVAANRNLAAALIRGDGGPSDEREAVKYLRCAALLGNSDAQYELAEILAEDSKSQSSPEPLAWYWIAAKSGRSNSELPFFGIAAPSGSSKAEQELIRRGWKVSEEQAAKLLDNASLLFLSSECPRDQDGKCSLSSDEGRRFNAKALSRRFLVHQMMSHALALQSFVGHAGDGGRQDTRGILEVLDLHRSALSSEDKPFMRIAVADGISIDSSEVVRMPRGEFWKYIHPGDSVLLSDRVTHHYTIVFGVDRVQDQIFLADAWPDRFFALHDPELQAQGVSLTHIGCGKRLVKMQRKLFESLAVSFSGIRDQDWPPQMEAAAKRIP